MTSFVMTTLALGEWVEFTGDNRILKPTIPSSQGWVRGLCQSCASLLLVVLNICDVLSSPVNLVILIFFDRTFCITTYS